MEGDASNLKAENTDRKARFLHISACDFKDVFEDDINYISKCAFGDFGQTGVSGANAEGLYALIHKEMKDLECSRCNMKGHSKAACWYGN